MRPRLAEFCRRVLKPEGALCFTVPKIVGRLTRSRDGLPKSYNGDPNIPLEDPASFCVGGYGDIRGTLKPERVAQRGL